MRQRRSSLWLLPVVLALAGTFLVAAQEAAPKNELTSGCLRHHGKASQLRICNSQDPPSAIGKYCRLPEFDYLELRIYGGNWESRLIAAWVLQILLSEVLGVPASIETGVPGDTLNFYDPENRPLEYGNNKQEDAMERGAEIGDCRLVVSKNGDEITQDSYQSCAHMVPEIWDADNSWTSDSVYDGIIEPPQGLGLMGEETWFITKHTVQKDPTLATYLGLQGPNHRQKLAETFLRPTTFKEYCEEVSPHNCSEPDDVAQRAPMDDKEKKSMFKEDIYTGHFRATEANNCTKWPDNCTGHIADYPCGWSSYTEAQVYHLDIAMESNGPEPNSGGYTYSQLQGMWSAAKATHSDMMGMWWTPEPLYQAFLGTDAELHKVTLPPKTQQCVDARPNRTQLCAANLKDRVGEPAGACTQSTVPLQKLISGVLFDLVHDPGLPAATVSPAYEALRLFRMSEQQLGQIFDHWRNETYKNNPRHAVCAWAAEHVEYLQSFVPATYPRQRVYNDGVVTLPLITTILGAVVTSLVLLTGLAIHVKHKNPSIQFAQIEFLWLLLAGSLFIAVGATVVGVPPSNGSCLAAIWLINLGYTAELVPLCVKVAAVNKLMKAASQFRRVRLQRNKLYGSVAFISIFVVAFLIVWTVMDSPQREAEYSMTDSQTEDGTYYVVSVSYYCSSESPRWQYIAVGWNALLLLCASVLAFQTRHTQQNFNESATLAFLIYSHFMFVVLRLITLFLTDNVSHTVLNQVRGIIFCLDTTATLLIYFVPKLTASDIMADSSMVNRASRLSMALPNNGASRVFVDHSRRLASATSSNKSASREFADQSEEACPNCGLSRRVVGVEKHEDPSVAGHSDALGN